MSGKRIRELTKLAAQERVVILEKSRTSKSQIRLKVRAEWGGDSHLVICSATPSDHRANKKIRAQFRRIYKGGQP